MSNIEKDFKDYIKKFKDFDKEMASDINKFSANTKDKWTKFLAYYQIKTMESYNRWFIGLTIAIIILTLVNIILSFYHT